MTLGATLRFIHVAAGFAGLALGPVLMLAGKRSSLHHRGGAIYFGLLSVTCVSALSIAALAWERLWPFAVAAVGTWLFGCAV